MITAFQQVPEDVDRALILIAAICGVLLLGITIVMLLFVFKYSRKKAKKTSQVGHHTKLEIAWTVLPTILVIWMFFIGYSGFKKMRDVPEGAMVVEVTGRQWAWSFHYPKEKVDSMEMVVPVGEPVKVEITAPPEDVIHSFYLPEFRVKEDAVPGRTSYLWFMPERKGTYNVFCAEFCGKDHSKMTTVLRVVSKHEYREWIRTQIALRYKPLVYEALTDPEHKSFGPEELNIDAKRIYRTFCVSCHGENGDGSGLPGEARDFRLRSGWQRGPKVTTIYRTLEEGLEGTQMRAFPNFTPWERVALGHYVRTFLKEKLPTDSKKDFEALVKKYGLDKIRPPGKTLSIERAMEIMVEEAKNK
jgi:cytochrome c oxidase subunit 2